MISRCVTSKNIFAGIERGASFPLSVRAERLRARAESVRGQPSVLRYCLLMAMHRAYATGALLCFHVPAGSDQVDALVQSVYRQIDCARQLAARKVE